MKFLCLLLVALAALIGVEGQEIDCTYAKCYQLLNNTVPTREDYCVKYNETKECLTVVTLQCEEVNTSIALAIANELNMKKPTCSAITDVASTPTPASPSGVDCTYSNCFEYFHLLFPTNNTLYCTLRSLTYDCLSSTKSSCQRGGFLHNHDAIKMELDQLPSCANDSTNDGNGNDPTNKTSCVSCDDLYEALNPNDTDYCIHRAEVEDCVSEGLRLCANIDEVYWSIFTISVRLDQLPGCDGIDNRNTTRPPVCLNGVVDSNMTVKLNAELPNFVSKDNFNTYCSTEHKEDFYHCSFYSYSHLRAFNSDGLHTCSSPGLWALFSHPALTVTALNLVPSLNGPYTLVHELNVIISPSHCSQETIYRASAVKDYLPATFEDKTTGSNGTELFLNSNHTSAYVKIPWISTTIAIHKLAEYIGVVVQSPASVANESVGLCSLGCPDHSKLTVSKVVHDNLISDCTQEAFIACSINNLTLLTVLTAADTYYEQCVFDTIESTNSNSSWISLVMVENWSSLGPVSFHQLPEYEQLSDKDTSSTNNHQVSLGFTVTSHIAMVTWCLSLYTTLYILLS